MLITEDQLPAIRERHQNEKLVLAVGTFDILHQGHMDYLDAARQHGDVLVVGLANDREVRARKGPGRPVLKQQERSRIIDSVKAVDYTVIRKGSRSLGSSMLRTAQLLKPDVIMFGPDVPEDVLALFSRKCIGTQIVVDSQPKVGSTTDVIRRVSRSYRLKYA